MLHNLFIKLHSISLSMRIFIGAIIWTIFISYMHYQLNFDHGKVKTVSMGYMPVVTNLAAPLLDHVSQDSSDIRFKALKFSSFAEMGESLRNGQIDVAFIIAPLSIVLKQQGEDVKVVYIGNRHESTFVTRSDLNINDIRGLHGKTVAVPMRFSGHNLSVLELLEQNNLTGKVNVVEMNPPDMASALMSGSLDAYYVGEPFAVKTLKSGDARLLHYAEDVWKNFICNVAVVRQDLIENDPEAVQKLVEAAARSGVWANQNPHKAASIVADYWNQSKELVVYALTKPANRTVYDLYVPKSDEMQHLANVMKKHKLIKADDISGLVDDIFAKSADVSGITNVESIIK